MKLKSTDIFTVKLPSKIWTLATNTTKKELLAQVGDHVGDANTIIKLDLSTRSHQFYVLPFEKDEWIRLASFQESFAYFIRYVDRNDPTKYEFIQHHLDRIEYSQVNTIPEVPEVKIDPYVYEHESDYFNTVKEFLGLDLPLSCEYLELGDKIIISYYLRSENGFDRFLLILKGGEKELKIRQDQRMKGFSPGAFFVIDDQLVFIKDQNEICFYPV